MKIFSFILALFFAFLTTVPCNDTEKGVGNQFCTVENIHLEKTQDVHSDLCTPFCVCSCCGMSLQIEQIATLLPTKISTPVDKQVTENIFNYELLCILGIWQPPKIG